MNLHSFADGLVLGLLAMTGVFLILAIIGIILYAFELIFYRSQKSVVEENKEVQRVISEEGIPGSVIAAITAAIYQYVNSIHLNPENSRIRIKKHKKKINKTYEKLKLERWRNG